MHCLMNWIRLSLWGNNETIFFSEKPMFFTLSVKILWSKFSQSILRSITCIYGIICFKTWLINIQQFISLKKILNLMVNWFFYHLWEVGQALAWHTGNSPCLHCLLWKSRKRRLGRAMKSPLYGKAVWADITCAKF